MKTLEELEKQLADIQKEVETLKQAKPEFEKDCWYRIHYTMQHCYGLKQYYSVPFYIVRFKWTSDVKHRVVFELADGTEVMMSNEENIEWLERKATPTEVQEALEKEAVKKGFKPGDQITGLWPYDESMKPVINNSIGGYYYIPESDTFGLNNAALYCKGVWATVIKEQPLMIGGYEVVFCDNSTYTTIDGNPFSKKFWLAAKLISEHSKAKIMVGCSKQFDVSLELINQILEKLK